MAYSRILWDLMVFPFSVVPTMHRRSCSCTLYIAGFLSLSFLSQPLTIIQLTSEKRITTKPSEHKHQLPKTSHSKPINHQIVSESHSHGIILRGGFVTAHRSRVTGLTTWAVIAGSPATAGSLQRHASSLTISQPSIGALILPG
jgi:hypothetical protein